MLGPAMDMSAPESWSTYMFAEPLWVEISAWMVSTGWITACGVLIEGVTWMALVVSGV